MKSLSILAAFLGGAVVGAAAGVLFAPERGEDTRNKIVDALRKKRYQTEPYRNGRLGR